MILGIYGYGGLGREIYDVALYQNKISKNWNDIIFIDDFKDKSDDINIRLYRFNDINNIYEKNEIEFIVGVGEPIIREKIYNKLKSFNYKLTNVISPTAIISKDVQIGEGSIICEFVTLHTGVKIGNNCLIQPYACMGHDIVAGNHCVFGSYFAPGGASKYGDRVYCGMQSTVKELLTICDDAIIGMGAVVIRDVNVKETLVGNPARPTIGNLEHRVFK